MKILISLFIFMLSSQLFPQWTALNSGTGQNLNALCFINTQTGFATGAGGTMMRTTNGGQNWVSLNTGTGAELRSVYFLSSSNGVACGFNGTILRTTNEGSNWMTVTSGTSEHLLGISFYQLTGVISGNTGTMLYSTNGGGSWAQGYPQGYLVTFYSAFMISATAGYSAGVNTIFSPLIGKTTNGGVNWNYYSFLVNGNEATLRDIHFFNEQNGIAVSNLWNGQGGISRTTNGGMNWSSQIFPLALYGVDFPVSSVGYAVGYNGYILKSSDSGNNWTQQSSGTGAFLKAVDFLDSLTGYAAGDGGTILKTTNGGITGFNGTGNEVPSSHRLYQNYPNPFNPVTRIRFDVASDVRRETLSPPDGKVGVKLVIYEILGKETTVFLDEQLKPGTYEFEWDGTRYPSGVYYYRLVSGDFTETKKMVLLK